MPLIDDIGLIPFSTVKQLSTILNTPAKGHSFSGDAIEAIKDTLVACGWTLAASIPATASIDYPLGFQFTTATGTGNVGCSGAWLSITTPIATFGFSSYTPGQTPTGTGCIQFPLGTTAEASLLNLASAITESLGAPFTATVSGSGPGYLITLTAYVEGPLANYASVAADGRFGVASGAVVGGGYTLTSNGPSPYSVTITGQDAGFPTFQNTIQFDFLIGPSGFQRTISFTLDTNAVGQYKIAANPFSFAIFDGEVSSNSLAVFAPNIDTAQGFTAAYAVTVIGPDNLQNLIMWDGYNIPCTVCLDTYPATFGSNFSGPGVLCLRSEPGGLPLYSLDGRPISTAAYLFMGQNSTGDPYVIGKLWDCMVITDAMAMGGTFQSGGRNYVCISTQDGSGSRSRGSLLFCTSDNGLPD